MNSCNASDNGSKQILPKHIICYTWYFLSNSYCRNNLIHTPLKSHRLFKLISFFAFDNLFTSKKINPLVGAAGVSAVPMAARVVQKVGAAADKRNYLLMFAMGPNIAGVIGTVIAAGIFISILK